MVARTFTTLLCFFALLVPALAQQPGGLNIIQGGAASWTGPGFLTYNNIDITSRTDDAAPDSRSMGLYLHSSVGGSSQVGAYYGLFSQMLHDQNSASGGDHIALVGQSTSVASDTSGGEVYGVNAVSECSEGCVALGINGLESDVGLDGGGTTERRTAIRATNQSNGIASKLDTAYSITSTNASGSFQHGFTLSGQFGAYPIQTNGDMFYSDTSGSLYAFANLPNVTINGYIFNFPNYQVTGNGLTWAHPLHYANLPACTQGLFGAHASIYDSTVNTWSAIISGGGVNHVLAYCDGRYWTVAAI